MNINWSKELMARSEFFISDLRKLIQIPSVKTASEIKEAPYGEEVRRALDYMMELGKRDGFQTKTVDGVAGHLEMGQGKELIGILCHVDVVPAGSGWSREPFGAAVEENKIYGRGAIDDKGPTMAAYYAMKVIKEMGIPLEKRVRLIVGTDEESDWGCVERYFEIEEMPDAGFAPDAEFPIIFAEKGIADVRLDVKVPETSSDTSRITLESFQAGDRFNMVPDTAVASLCIEGNHTHFLQNYKEFLEDHHLTGRYYIESGEVILELKGKSAHAMEPNDGENAALLLAGFFAKQSIDPAAAAYIQLIADSFFEDTRGKKLGIDGTDPEMGEVTVNAALFRYVKNKEAFIGINVRYPVSFSFEEKIKKLQDEKAEQLTIMVASNSKPHYVDPKNEFIQTLQRVYEQETGEEAKLLSIGGGTYARALKAGVAFGALFPGRPDVAHQKDEYAFLDDLLKASVLYAKAIVELAGKKEK